MTKIICAILLASLVSSAIAGSIECTGKTIEDGDGKPARMIVTYKSFPHKLGTLTVITDEVRRWKITDCLIGWEKECKSSHQTDPSRIREGLTFRHVSRDNDELALSFGKIEGKWVGAFWDGSIMNPEITVEDCKFKP